MFRPLFHQSVRWHGSKARRIARIPRRAVDSDGQDVQIRSDQLEGNVQARQVAALAEQNLRGTKLGRGARSPQTPVIRAINAMRLPSDSTKPDPIVNETDLNEDLRNQHLPENFDWKSLPRFVKLNAWDGANPTWKMLRKNLSRNDKHGDAVVLENHRLIKDAMNEGIHPYLVAFSRVNLLLELPFDANRSYEMFQVPYTQMQDWSELTTPPGMMAVFKKSAIIAHAQAKMAKETIQDLPITLILDNLRNPDNVGTILRTAAGIGCRQVLLTSGCVDPWQGKVVRAGAGAHFHVPIMSKVRWEQIHQLVPPYAQVVMADVNKFKTDQDPPLDHNAILSRILELNERCSEFHSREKPNVHFRQGGMGETFAKREVRNVKNLSEDDLEEYLTQKVADELEKSATETEESTYLDLSYNEPDILEEFKAVPLITKEYQEFERYNKDQAIVVVIGGETQGISLEAVKFTHQNQGDRLYIPLRRSIESLNVASAASILLFEIQKKIAESNKDDIC